MSLTLPVLADGPFSTSTSWKAQEGLWSPQADSLLIVLTYLQLTITAGNSRRTEKNQSK